MGHLYQLADAAPKAPNLEVVGAIEALLGEAREGRIQGLVCLAQRPQNVFTHSVHGACRMEPENALIPAFKGILSMSGMKG